LPGPSFRTLQDEDWANAWKEHYRPFRVGQRLWIWPSWLDPVNEGELAESIEAEDLVMVLDPGMAFGTGSHPTTQMCLLHLEALVRPGMRLLDVGTGSAILAIAGAKLGAGTLLGIDSDELAVKTALANVIQNGESQRIAIEHGTLETVDRSEWDIVVVNILAPVIIDLMQNHDLLDYLACDGHLILSGIINQQAGDVRAAIANAGGEISQRSQMGDWISFVVKRVSGK
jgi:ribosomal protein L11 methyltransferase